ncbi:MAG TPA: EamA family transporter [Candidatus Sulfotelmatobacter sp.]|nr:EamA family transporter [Candidatus Sulfotelmatobacter sp.]
MALAAAAARRAPGATLVGGGAILLWSVLALLTAQARDLPPFLLTALAFGVAFALALGKWLWRGENILAHCRLPARVWAVGVGGVGGYHVLYFLALRSAPPVEANLINYLWPLLIVLFSAFLPGERLRWFHLAGALTGLAGTALIVTGGRLVFHGEFLVGYLAALGCAAVWAAYSVLSRRLAAVPTDAVGAFCGVTAVLALACHLLFEAAAWPQRGEWLIVLALGLGPVGGAFYLWDFGVKRGDIRALGAAAYATPLLSTALLVAFGIAVPSLALGVAALLVVAGAALGAGDLLYGRRS